MFSRRVMPPSVSVPDSGSGATGCGARLLTLSRGGPVSNPAYPHHSRCRGILPDDEVLPWIGCLFRVTSKSVSTDSVIRQQIITENVKIDDELKKLWEQAEKQGMTYRKMEDRLGGEWH